MSKAVMSVLVVLALCGAAQACTCSFQNTKAACQSTTNDCNKQCYWSSTFDDCRIKACVCSNQLTRTACDSSALGCDWTCEWDDGKCKDHWSEAAKALATFVIVLIVIGVLCALCIPAIIIACCCCGAAAAGSAMAGGRKEQHVVMVDQPGPGYHQQPPPQGY